MRISCWMRILRTVEDEVKVPEDDDRVTAKWLAIPFITEGKEARGESSDRRRGRNRTGKTGFDADGNAASPEEGPSVLVG